MYWIKAVFCADSPRSESVAGGINITNRDSRLGCGILRHDISREYQDEVQHLSLHTKHLNRALQVRVGCFQRQNFGRNLTWCIMSFSEGARKRIWQRSLKVGSTMIRCDLPKSWAYFENVSTMLICRDSKASLRYERKQLHCAATPSPGFARG